MNDDRPDKFDWIDWITWILLAILAVDLAVIVFAHIMAEVTS